MQILVFFLQPKRLISYEGFLRLCLEHKQGQEGNHDLGHHVGGCFFFMVVANSQPRRDTDMLKQVNQCIYTHTSTTHKYHLTAMLLSLLRVELS